MPSTSRRCVRGIALAAALLLAACGKGATAPEGREAAPQRDRDCKDPARPKAYFHRAEDGRRYAPEDPRKDGCELLVPEHLFCCPQPPAGAR